MPWAHGCAGTAIYKDVIYVTSAGSTGVTIYMDVKYAAERRGSGDIKECIDNIVS